MVFPEAKLPMVSCIAKDNLISYNSVQILLSCCFRQQVEDAVFELKRMTLMSV